MHTANYQIALLLISSILGCSKNGTTKLQTNNFTYTASQIDSWRNEANRLRAAPIPRMRTSARWIPSVQDPNAILLAFSHLKPQDGRSYISYVWSGQDIPSSYNMSSAFTKTYAIWTGACYEDPVCLPKSKIELYRKQHGSKPYPEHPIRGVSNNLENILSILIPDSDPISYLQAVVFRLEIQDFPNYWEQYWNNIDTYPPWSEHTIIDDNPDEYVEIETASRVVHKSSALKNHAKSINSITWKWQTNRPTNTAPIVSFNAGTARVTLYTISTFRRKQIFRHIIHFKLNSIEIDNWKTELLADGGPGWVLS